jgi:hypothetical protein
VKRFLNNKKDYFYWGITQNQDMIGEIHTIFEGLASGGDSNLARKAHTRRVNVKEVLLSERPPKAQKDSMILAFSEEDAERVVMPHDDALVVTITMTNNAIHWILVDNGSSADILYWPIFKQMGIDRVTILNPFRVFF